jgi:two-component system cell cycle sensor histidine kinase PleC
VPIAKSLIELHGGTLTVESTPKVGTTMIATFPASRIVAVAA